MNNETSFRSLKAINKYLTFKGVKRTYDLCLAKDGYLNIVTHQNNQLFTMRMWVTLGGRYATFDETEAKRVLAFINNPTDYAEKNPEDTVRL